MSEEIPEETLKQWGALEDKALDEFIESGALATNMCPNFLRDAYFKAGFKAAKTSSYELKENLRKRGNNLSKECVELQKEIQKRDELLENSEALLRSFKNLVNNEPKIKLNSETFGIIKKIEQWLKQYEELKR